MIPKMCDTLLLAAYKGSLPKSLKPASKLSTALCGLIQVFLIVLYAQYFQNTFISARKLQNSTHPIQSPVLQTTVILDVGEFRLK